MLRRVSTAAEEGQRKHVSRTNRLVVKWMSQLGVEPLHEQVLKAVLRGAARSVSTRLPMGTSL